MLPLVAAIYPRSRSACFARRWLLTLTWLSVSVGVFAQAPLPIYTDRLMNGFQDWSWGTRNFSNTSPVHSGANSISTSFAAWDAISLYHADIATSLYATLEFWANGGAGGQRLLLSVDYGTNSSSGLLLPALPTNSWQRFSIPLANFGAANLTNLSRLNFKLTTSGKIAAFYLDDIQFIAKPAPALIHLNVDATQSVRSADDRWFGINTAVWDGYLDTPQTLSLLGEMGTRILRFPGGSMSDTYHWRSNYVVGSTWQGWPSGFSQFVHVATNLGAQAFITVNYGSGSAGEAADWVRFANVTNQLGFRYWEVGNECYGTWEFDTNKTAPYHPNDAWTYANRFKDYYLQMKSADPTIRIGIVVTPGETSSSNNFANLHPVINPRTGRTNYGWTPILLNTLSNLNVTPDFAVHHVYPEYTSQESDPLLLQSTGNWAQDAADLRQQLTDYLGAPGDAVELVCTENNSNAGTQGKQSVSLVNALYYADSLARLMKTEFNAFVWWDLRNGVDYGGNLDPTLYGWRMYGDIGMINGSAERYPHFYAAKLMRHFVQSGDTVLNVSSDYPLLSAYAVRHASGSLSILAIHKDPTTNFTAQFSFTGYSPDTAATLTSYGIPQDEAARTNAPAGMQDLATNQVAGVGSSNFVFAPYSINLLTFRPSSPQLTMGTDPTAGIVWLQLQGQPAARYVVQTSSDLQTWSSFATNTLSGNSWGLTNSWSSGTTAQFWRAVWEP